jgi:V/A-type H+-transporting ATPase subunit A
VSHRERLLSLLDRQAELERMARIVGKDALPPGQQLILLCADLVNEAFLRQSAFSAVDRYCSPKRQTAMLKLVLRFIEFTEQALKKRVAPQAMAELAVMRKLRRMSEDVGEDELDRFESLGMELEAMLSDLEKAGPHAG